MERDKKLKGLNSMIFEFKTFKHQNKALSKNDFH